MLFLKFDLKDPATSAYLGQYFPRGETDENRKFPEGILHLATLNLEHAYIWESPLDTTQPWMSLLKVTWGNIDRIIRPPRALKNGIYSVSLAPELEPCRMLVQSIGDGTYRLVLASNFPHGATVTQAVQMLSSACHELLQQA